VGDRRRHWCARTSTTSSCPVSSAERCGSGADLEGVLGYTWTRPLAVTEQAIELLTGDLRLLVTLADGATLTKPMLAKITGPSTGKGHSAAPT